MPVCQALGRACLAEPLGLWRVELANPLQVPIPDFRHVAWWNTCIDGLSTLRCFCFRVLVWQASGRMWEVVVLAQRPVALALD